MNRCSAVTAILFQQHPGLEMKLLEFVTSGSSLIEGSSHLQEVNGIMEEKFKTGKNRWFFQKLRF